MKEDSINFIVEKMFRIPQGGPLKAFVDVSVGDLLTIKGVRVLEGKKGLFVSMPKERGKDNKWYDQIILKSAKVYEEMSDKVLASYQLKV